jgi:chemotaxis protein MotB
MKDKPSEWIAISDLMAGVMAVVMLMLVMAVLQKNNAEAQHKKEIVEKEDSSNQSIKKVLTEVKKNFASQQVNELFSVDIKAGRITMKDNVFSSGSACITPTAQNALAAIEKQISSFLGENAQSIIYVEGYTDNVPVKRPVIDFERFCTVYDDNYTLSAARAREARKYLIGVLDGQVAKRVIVAGYGESRLLSGMAASDSRNRRVEILFSIAASDLVAKDTFNDLMRQAMNNNWSVIDRQIRLIKTIAFEVSDAKIAENFKKSGLNFLTENKFSNAIVDLEKSLVENSGDIDVKNALGYAEFREGKLDKSINHLLDALMLDPTNAAVWLNLAEVFAQADKNSASEASLRMAIHFARDQAKALDHLNNVASSSTNSKFETVVKNAVQNFSSIPKFSR